MLRRELCGRIAACDSIRTPASGQTVDATIYNKPPRFIQNPQDEEKTDSTGAMETPIPKQLLFSPEPRLGASSLSGVPTISFRDRPDNVKSALSKLKTAIEYCFLKPQAVFVAQSSFNDKSAKMTQKKEKHSLAAKADGALKVYALHSGPDGKLDDELNHKRKMEASSQLERENQALRDQLAVSESKRLKAEAKAKNSTGGPKVGAHSTKSNRPSTVNTPNPRPSGGRTATNQKGKGGRNQIGGRGQGRGENRGATQGRGGNCRNPTPAAAAAAGVDTSTSASNASEPKPNKRLRKKKKKQEQSSSKPSHSPNTL